MECPCGRLGWDALKSSIHKPNIHSGKSLCWNYHIWHCQIAAIILAAKHLGENTKIPALTNPTFTAASDFARIPKSSIAKFHQLYWRQNTLVKIPKIQHSHNDLH